MTNNGGKMNSFIKDFLNKLNHRGYLKFLPDKIFLKLIFWVRTGKRLNLKNPHTYNEKLQWLKLYDRKDKYTTMVDKYEVKKYVSEIIGEKYVVPLLGVWDSVEDIEFDKLPEKFVLKATHNSGGIVICRNKTSLDIETVKNKLSTVLKKNYFFYLREWPYKNVKPRIIAEKLMENSKQKENTNLNVYKIFCFDGKPEIIQTIQNDKTPDETIDYFDVSWNLLDLKQSFPNSKTPLGKPSTLEEMLSLAAKLSKGVAFLRVDFYDVNEEIYFSEFTFYSDSGMANFYPENWNCRLGELINI